MRYPEKRERFLEGLKRQRACASGKLPYAWLRFDTCADFSSKEDVPKIRDSRSVSYLFHDTLPFQNMNREAMLALCLDTKNRPIGVYTLSLGGRAGTGADVSLLLQAVILAGAVGFIIVHTHPSQHEGPSEEDLALTKRIKSAAEIVGVKLLDHVILTTNRDQYFSFADAGVL